MRENVRKKKHIQKTIAVILCTFMTVWFAADLTVEAAPIAGVPSVCYMAIDAATGEVLADLNADVPIFPASTTKLVTAMAICDVLPMDSVLVVSQSALDKVIPGSSKVGLKAGGEYFAYELLEMMLISSGADATEVLVEASYGTEEACLAKMNEKMVALGLASTHFDNVTGLDIGNGYTGTFTTAREFAIVTQAAMKYDWIRVITGLASYQIPARTNNEAIVRNNTNQFLIGKQPYSAELYTVIGSKTGTTKAAGSVLAATATNGTREVICVCFYNPNTEVLYTSVKQIFDAIYSGAVQPAA